MGKPVTAVVRCSLSLTGCFVCASRDGPTIKPQACLLLATPFHGFARSRKRTDTQKTDTDTDTQVEVTRRREREESSPPSSILFCATHVIDEDGITAIAGEAVVMLVHKDKEQSAAAAEK